MQVLAKQKEYSGGHVKEIFDFAKLVKRKVEQRQLEGRPAYAIVLESTYDVDANELWDALTNKDRLSLWFLPVSGELRTGGNYQLEGNAKGSINRCDQPKGFDITWEFGDNVSWVKVDLTAVTESQTTLRLEHLAIAEGEHWENYGPGAVGVGWDLGIGGLGNYIRTHKTVDQEAFFACPEYREFVSFSSKDWGEAACNAGYDREESIAVAKRTEKFYLGE